MRFAVTNIHVFYMTGAAHHLYAQCAQTLGTGVLAGPTSTGCGLVLHTL